MNRRYFEDDDDDGTIIDLSCLSPEKRELALRELKERMGNADDDDEDDDDELPFPGKDGKPAPTNGILPKGALERMRKNESAYRLDEDESKWQRYAKTLDGIKVGERKLEDVDDRKLFKRIKDTCTERHLSEKVGKKLLPLMIAALRGKPVKPLIFYGPAGCGKTYSASLLADMLEMPLVRISAPRAELSHGYQGEVGTYKNPDAGEFIRGIVEKESVSCVFFIDEIDKAASAPSTRVKQQDELLNIIADRSVNDNFMGFPVDISTSIVVFAVNELESLSAPFIDRCNLIEFNETEPERLCEILRDYVNNSVLPYYEGRVLMDDELLFEASRRLCSSGIRSIRQHENLADGGARQAYDRYLSSEGGEPAAVTNADLEAALESICTYRTGAKEIGFRSDR